VAVTTDLSVLSVSIVPMRWWHVEAVLAIEREVFAEEPWTSTMFWSELAEWETRSYVVALTEHVPGDAGEVVGYAGLCVYPDEAFVQTLAVRPDHRRRGIGARLLQRLIAEAERRGAPTLSLEVRADNAVAQHLYESHGFRRCGIRKGYYAFGTVDAVVMSRGLRAADAPDGTQADGASPAAPA
jgi:ribosomal-protein-alanine N-acetyltransferase